MNEYYVELVDHNGTYYGTTDRFDNTIYFEDLDEARLYAKSQLTDEYIMTRVVDSNTRDVVDFFERNTHRT